MGLYGQQILPVYLTPLQLRRMLGTELQSTNDDDLLLWFISHASRKIDEYTNRKFYIYRQVINADFQGHAFHMDMPEDLHTVLTLTNGNGVVIPPTTTVGANTIQVHMIYPPQEYPKYRVSLNITSGYVYLFTGSPQQAIQLDCLFGFPAITNNGTYHTNSGATVQNAVSQDAATTTLLAPTGFFQVGETLLIGSEVEIIQSITTGATNDILTVLRGAIGTTAEAHLNGTTISKYIYHDEIVHACARLSAFYYRQKDSAGQFDSVGMAGYGQITIPLQFPPDIKATLSNFVRNSR